MDGREIKKQIEKNNDLIAQNVDAVTFTLNDKVRELLEENKRLSAQCPHQFKKGRCIFCNKKEEVQ